MAGPVKGSLTIINALIYDDASRGMTEGSLRIVDGMITEIGTVRAAGRVLDAHGGTIIPGLIDAHFHAYGVHAGLLETETSSTTYLAIAGAGRLTAALRRGFTTVRDVAGGDAGLAKAVAEGLIPAPRYLFTGPALSQTGGHGDPRPADAELWQCGTHMCEVVDGVEPLRRAVRERFRQGAHAIKIMTSGGIISPADPIRVPQYAPEEIRAVTEEASRRGSYVAAHAYSAEAIAHSVCNGVRSVEHGNLLDEESARLMAERDAFLVPTLAAYDSVQRRGKELGLSAVSLAKNDEVLAAGCHAIDRAIAAGVQIGFGTDLMGPAEDEQLQGLRLQAEIMGPSAALRSATAVNADLLGRADLGRIALGATADLILLDGNPLVDATALWAAHRTVIRGGVPVTLPAFGCRRAIRYPTPGSAGHDGDRCAWLVLGSGDDRTQKP